MTHVQPLPGAWIDFGTDVIDLATHPTRPWIASLRTAHGTPPVIELRDIDRDTVLECVEVPDPGYCLTWVGDHIVLVCAVTDDDWKRIASKSRLSPDATALAIVYRGERCEVRVVDATSGALLRPPFALGEFRLVSLQWLSDERLAVLWKSVRDDDVWHIAVSSAVGEVARYGLRRGGRPDDHDALVAALDGDRLVIQSVTTPGRWFVSAPLGSAT